MTLSQEFIASMLARRGEIDAQISARARLHVLDSIGIGLGARATKMGRQVVSAMTEGAGGSCGIYGDTRRLAPASAAFVNSALSHILDFDDINDMASVHATTVTLPAALAAAELAGAGGSDVIAAVILGNEFMCRLGTAVKLTNPVAFRTWFVTQLFGYYGATFAAGVVLRMSEPEIVSAFGLAYLQLAGGKEMAAGTGGNARSIYTGFAAQGGVSAALLARSGLLGPASSLDGDFGLFKLYLGQALDEKHKRAMLDAPGWLWADTSIKPYPSCRLSHPYVAVALDLAQKVELDDIERIVVATNERGWLLSTPIEARCNPATLTDAKFSIPFMVAFAMARRRVDINNLDESALTDPAVLSLTARMEVDQRLPYKPGPAPAEVTVRRKDGSEVTVGLSHGLALGPEETRRKFEACLEFGGLGARAGAIWTALQGMERMTAAEIMNVVGASAAQKMAA